MNGNQGTTQATSSAGGAAPALEGYFYQLDVSILIAIDLVLARKVSRSVLLEPASHEDLESEIEHEPGVLAEAVDLDAYRLIIQCKRKTTGPWKRDALVRVLNHGTRRPSVAQRLQDANVRFVLVTDADVDGTPRALCIKELGVWPSATEMPSSITKALPSTAPGRLAILSLMDAEKISAQTERLLMDRFRVPRSELNACRRALQQEALLRMRGAGGGLWTREELASMIKNHGGFLGRSEDLVGFVPPTNWARLKETLARQHVVIITGPSGVGKTRSAKALIAELRDELPGVTVVHVGNGGPEKIRHERERLVVFEVVDPWGKYRPEANSVPWNDAIDELLRSAGPERKFVITSRSDVLRESGPKQLRARWVVHLEPEHYRRKDRARLFLNRLKSLPSGLQSLVKQYRKDAVDELRTPLEMDRYFAGLEEGFVDLESEEEFIFRCIREAHRDSIERSIVQNVRLREVWHWAAIVWGLFKAREHLSFSVMPLIQAGLTRRDPRFEDGLAPYVNFLIAGRHLHQSESVLSYQHPRVEFGLEQALNEKPELASRALHYLVETLIVKDIDSDEDWGVEGAAHLVQATRIQAALHLELTPPTQAVLDHWLHARLAATDSTFEDDIYMVAAVGSTSCPAAELARWLVHSRDMPWVSNDETWVPPEVSAQWYAWVRADPATRAICEAFIRRLLPMGRGFTYFDTDFIDHLRKLVPDPSAACRDAALAIVREADIQNAGAIAYGALADLDAFEPVLHACLDSEAGLAGPESVDEWLARVNGEFDAEAERALEHRDWQEYCADVLVAAYVRERRRVHGWTVLRDHSRASELVHDWLRAIGTEEILDDEEILALSALARHTQWEVEFWDFATRRWRAAFMPILRRRVLEGGENDAALRGMLRTLALRMHSEVPDVAAHLASRGDIKRLLAIATRFGSLLAQSPESLPQQERAQIQSTLQGFISPLSTTLSDAANALVSSVPLIDTEALSLLTHLNSGRDHELKLAQARVLAAHGIDVSALIEELLTPRCNLKAEIVLSRAAVKVASNAKLWGCVENALQHRFADVREEALRALSARTSGPVPSHLLCLATDKGCGVREALLDILEEHPQADHTDALINLAADRWTPDCYHPEYPARYVIAQRAAQLLRELPPVDAAHAKQLAEIAIKAEDPDLVRALFEVVLRSSSEEARRSVLQVALETGSPPYHRLAAEALWNQADHLTELMVAEISNRQLLGRAPTMAFYLARVVGARATPDQVLAATQALAAHTERRALVIPLYLSMREQPRGLKGAVLRLLPEALGEALRRATEDGETLAPDALDTFGDADIVAQIRGGFRQLFRSPPESWSINI